MSLDELLRGCGLLLPAVVMWFLRVHMRETERGRLQSVHMQTVLYAAFAVATDEEGEMLIGDAFRAHQLCTLLIEDLCERALDDAMFARRWYALRDHIEQHMDAEERELFPLAARLLAAEMEEITAAMQEIQEPILVS